MAIRARGDFGAAWWRHGALALWPHHTTLRLSVVVVTKTLLWRSEAIGRVSKTAQNSSKKKIVFNVNSFND